MLVRGGKRHLGDVKQRQVVQIGTLSEVLCQCGGGGRHLGDVEQWSVIQIRTLLGWGEVSVL